MSQLQGWVMTSSGSVYYSMSLQMAPLKPRSPGPLSVRAPSSSAQQRWSSAVRGAQTGDAWEGWDPGGVSALEGSMNTDLDLQQTITMNVNYLAFHMSGSVRGLQNLRKGNGRR